MSAGRARRYFGTDGVRGIVGESLNADLVERLGRAATLWFKSGEVFVGRDTRASGVELEGAFARGVASAGGIAVLAGVLPTPAVALLAAGRLGAVISASHNPPEYNGVKLFEREGHKLSDEAEVAIEQLLDAAPGDGGTTRPDGKACGRYVEHLVTHFGSDLTGTRIAVDCAHGAFHAIAPGVFERLGAVVAPVAAEPDGTNINVRCGATDLSLLSETVRAGDFDLGVAFDGDGDRMLAVDERGRPVDGDQILAILAIHLGVDLVAVTSMTNLGFHELMRERGVRVVTTDVGDRHVLEALRRHGGALGGEQSGHIIYLRNHVTGDGLAAALLLCAARGGRALSEAAAMPRYPQAQASIRVADRELSDRIRTQVDRMTAKLGDRGRILVRPSGTEPVVRVLVEARALAEARQMCDTIAALVRRELG